MTPSVHGAFESISIRIAFEVCKWIHVALDNMITTMQIEGGEGDDNNGGQDFPLQ